MEGAAGLLEAQRGTKGRRVGWMGPAPEGGSTKADVDLQFGEMASEAKEFSMTLHSELLGILTGTEFTEAARIKDSNGLEGMRERDHETGSFEGHHHAPAGHQSGLMKVEGHMKQYEALSRRPLDEDMVATVLISTCVRELRVRLDSGTKDMSYKEVRDHIMAFIERRREEGPTPMDIGKQEEEECSYYARTTTGEEWRPNRIG